MHSYADAVHLEPIGVVDSQSAVRVYTVAQGQETLHAMLSISNERIRGVPLSIAASTARRETRG